MTPTQVRELEEKIDRLEQMFIAYIRQDKHEDWLDKPEIVAMLDDIATKEVSISEDEVNF